MLGFKELIVAMSSSEGWAAKDWKLLMIESDIRTSPMIRFILLKIEEALYIINQNLKKYEGSYTRNYPT